MPARVVAVAGVVAALGGMFRLMARPAQVRVDAAGGELRVEPVGLDKLWCLHGGVRVPLPAVAGVRVARRADVALAGLAGLRLPGTYFPGVITAGSYGLGERRTFWDVRRADRLLVIDLAHGRAGAAAYRRLVLEVPDPDAVADRVRAALAPRALES